jgi:fumarylacetoacetase
MSQHTAGSWVESANQLNNNFPIENLPFGTFSIKKNHEDRRIGIAIGEEILDLKALNQSVEAPKELSKALELLSTGNLNAYMSLSGTTHRSFRKFLIELLQKNSSHQKKVEPCMVRQAEAVMHLPCRIGDYTDFYASIHHATTVGKMFRADNPLLPNYEWVPIGYHGRASSIVVSDTPIKRPTGQTRGSEGQPPIFQPCRRLDYELEMGIFIGAGNELGEPIHIKDASEHFFGMCILNDWSARDIQAWEYQPLGPFLAKNFASSISPWIVTREALEPFKKPWTRNANEAQPLPYLEDSTNRSSGAYNIELETLLQTPKMKADGLEPVRIMRSNFSEAAYWTIAQLITHHSSNGCNLSAGDLLGTGTLSGPKPEEAASLLELSNGGKNPLTLANGEERSFLEDGDTLILRAFCESPNAVRIGFGECRGTITAAKY